MRHGEEDPVLGDPLCTECFDYRGAVLWNAHLSALWARTSAGLYQEVARAAGLSTAELRAAARLSYFKVVEFQARGLAHLHVVLRADGGAGPADPPPRWLNAAALGAAVAGVVARAQVPIGAPASQWLSRARWGPDFDVRVLYPLEGDADAIAGYVGKYASKTADSGGWLAHPIRTRAEIERLGLRPHLVALVRTAWVLGLRRKLAALRLREHAHTLGYGGQFSSKSVAYSTTFSALRAARADYVEALRGARPDYDGEWRYAGRGYDSPEAETLAEALLDARLIVSRGHPTASAWSATESSTAP
jgi:hypothetical protein